LLLSFKNAQRETRDVNRRFVLQAIIVLVKLPFYEIKAKFFYTETYYGNLTSNYYMILETTTVPEQDNTAQWLAPTIAGLVSAIILIAIVIALILVVVSIVKFLISTHSFV